MAKIPAGFQMHIHTWENDGDAPGVEILSGLTREDVKFYLDLLQLFCSGNSNGYGNGIDLNFSIVGKAILEIYLDHPKVSKDVKGRFEWLKEMKSNDKDGLSDGLHEIMGDILGNPATYEYDFRVFDMVEIFEILTPINDVTSKFKVKKRKIKDAEGGDDADEPDEDEEA